MQIVCSENNNPVNLTAAVAELQFAILPRGVAVLGPWSYKPMTVDVPATSGIVQYDFSPSDLAEAGTLIYAVKLTFGNGTVLTSPNKGVIPVKAGSTGYIPIQSLVFSSSPRSSVQLTPEADGQSAVSNIITVTVNMDV